MKPTTIRVILSITPSRNWVVKQLDVNNAFLNGDLQEVYMQQPYGFQDPNQPTMVCHLHKFLYGLRQTLRAQFEKLYNALLMLGFKSTKSDQSLFVSITLQHPTFILVYVDDILVTRSNDIEVQKLIDKLHE